MIDDVLAIVKRCVTGNDDDAWNTFSDEFSKIAMNILNGRFYDLPAAEKEDVIQNIFVKLVRGGLRNFNGTSDYEFLSYFKTITMNEAFSYISKRGLDPPAQKLGEDRQAVDITSESPGPEIQAQRKEILHLLEDALKDCPLVGRLIVRLKLEDHKDREISEMLGIPLGTVAVKYARCKEKIRQRLSKFLKEKCI